MTKLLLFALALSVIILLFICRWYKNVSKRTTKRTTKPWNELSGIGKGATPRNYKELPVT